MYVYIIYTPNLGSAVAVFVQEREQSRFKVSSEGAKGSTKGVGGSTEGARREYGGTAQGSLNWLPCIRL